MRMWMIDPSLLCRQHLLGEHSEIHKHKHNFEKRHNMSGRIGQMFPLQMQARHDELVEELLRRGYNHNSPYEAPDVSYLPAVVLNAEPDLIANADDLFRRCTACRQRIERQTNG